ncbi:hypothetical protein SteCoe_18309 [Stentor coeruleus]|uniref:RING-type domain-containing protein n=1 Tax=Stentor coeruleus TaxID=5963 RepID=A0A1R2BWQ7_9CILI|nr:hypothetical protein SteCoe_18309 [Stentor coeruleus]
MSNNPRGQNPGPSRPSGPSRVQQPSRGGSQRGRVQNLPTNNRVNPRLQGNDRTRTENLMVSFFTPIASIGIPERNINALQQRFGAFKSLPPGANNFGQALIISIIDYSIINFSTDIICSMNELFNLNSYLMLKESERQTEVISMIYNIIIKAGTIEEKLIEAHKIYNDMNNEINLLFRNCLYIIVKQKFYSKKYEIQQSVKTQEEILNYAGNITAQPNIEDFVFITDYFDINLRILYEQSMQLTLFGTGVKYPIYLFESDRGYFPIYTLEDCQMRIQNYADFSEMSTFLRQIRETENRDMDKEIVCLNEEILKAKEESNAYIEVFFALNSYVNPTLVCDEAVKNLGTCENFNKIKCVLDELSCRYCNKLTRIGVLDCEHQFCVNCVAISGYSNDNRIICPICYYLTDYTKVIHLWNQ